MNIGPSGAETFWTTLLRKLAGQGRRGVKLLRRPRMHFSKGNLRQVQMRPPGSSLQRAFACELPIAALLARPSDVTVWCKPS